MIGAAPGVPTFSMQTEGPSGLLQQADDRVGAHQRRPGMVRPVNSSTMMTSSPCTIKDAAWMSVTHKVYRGAEAPQGN